jgi:hypothetical protein
MLVPASLFYPYRTILAVEKIAKTAFNDFPASEIAPL